MKNIHYYIYGLLTGSVLILSTLLLVKSFNDATAQGAASSSSDVAMVTGQYQNSESLLFLVTNNPENQNPVLLTYAAPGFNLSLVAARNLKYDRRVLDLSTGRPQTTQSNKTFPPYQEMESKYKQNQNRQGAGRGAGRNQ